MCSRVALPPLPDCQCLANVFLCGGKMLPAFLSMLKKHWNDESRGWVTSTWVTSARCVTTPSLATAVLLNYLFIFLKRCEPAPLCSAVIWVFFEPCLWPRKRLRPHPETPSRLCRLLHAPASPAAARGGCDAVTGCNCSKLHLQWIWTDSSRLMARNAKEKEKKKGQILTDKQQTYFYNQKCIM